MKGLCECGCGERTKIATRSDARKGWVKGYPLRFLPQHHRVLSPVEYVEQDCGYVSPCWVWQKTKTKNGYGQKYLPVKRRIYAHRFFWQAHHGRPVAEGLELDHLCRVRACVNPEHLEEVTRSENHRRSHRDNPRPRRNGAFLA